ncbi:hypothetical protein B0H13DRAFT_1884977 [Mycena leptocephala]|nr:hypothetical protein B0H13DRAFT_1884977 [Mycena leptocephala]
MPLLSSWRRHNDFFVGGSMVEILQSEVRSETYGARINSGIQRVIMAPDSILAVWRACPMYNAGRAHYYMNKLAHLKNGNFVVPICWLMYRGKVHANAFAVSFDEASNATIDDSKTVMIAAADLSENFFDLQDKKIIPRWSGA